MNCPNCGKNMEQGWLAVFNPLWKLTFVVWQSTKPKWVRMKIPAGGEKVIVPRAGGRGNPRSQLCRNCKTVVFSYADDQVD